MRFEEGSMKAMQVNKADQRPVLILAELPKLKAGPGEVVVHIHAAGVTPTELLWYPTTHTKSGQTRMRAVPGHEFSGVISEIGKDVPGFEVNDEVYGMNDWFSDGATAEFCITLPHSIARKPTSLTHELAATVPIGALTAWQGLFDRAQLQSGERVLIHGGAGAVGVLAIQLACRRGAHVLTTASGQDRDFLLRLGAQQVIDYHTERFEDVARNVDVVFDAVGGSTLQRSWGVLGPGGRLVTIVSTVQSADDERTKQALFFVEPNRRQLCDIAAMLDAGPLLPAVGSFIPFAQAAMAFAREPVRNRRPGKTVVTLIPPG